MGILSEEKAQELKAKMDSGSVFSVDVPPSEPEIDVKVSGSEAPEGAEEKVEATEVVQAEPATPDAVAADVGKSEGEAASKGSDGDHDEESDLPGHRVPYKRFKSVLSARNKFRDESEEAKAQVEAFKKQMESMRNEVAALRNLQPAKPAEPAVSEVDEIDAELARLLGNDTRQPAASKELLEKIQLLEQRQYETERDRERVRLESEVKQVTGKYDSIPDKELQQVLLHAVARDPTVSLVDVAEQYVTWKTGIEEAAIARYLEANPGSTQGEAQAAVSSASSAKPSVPPRPARTGTGASRAAVSSQKRIGSIKEGTDALMNAIKNGSVNLFG